MSQQPTYDPLVVNQENFDPITLMPVYDPAHGIPAALQTASGQPINFYIPPPPPQATAQPQAASWQDYLPYIIGFGTIALLIGIYFIIRKQRQ